MIGYLIVVSSKNKFNGFFIANTFYTDITPQK